MSRLFAGLIVLFLNLAGAAFAQPPNIVFILTDDLDAAAAATMEQVQALITDHGTRFDRHYVNVSLCCPSRVSTLRGQFAHNSGIISNYPPDGGFEGAYAKGVESSTIATWLKDAGYRTALFGKYLNGYPDTAPSPNYVPPGWTEWYAANGGFPYKGFNYTLNENGQTFAYGGAEADYMTDVLSAKATSFISRTVREHAGQPFFAYIATFAPHMPAVPAPRHADAFPGIHVPHTPSFNEADVSDKPAWVRHLPVLNKQQIAEVDLAYRHRRQSLLAVEDLVKSVMDTLQATGQLDNTYVFFSSDNGFHQGQHRLPQGKMSGFEEDIHVPLSVRGPGVPIGRVVDAFSANVDYAATFAELAGVAVPPWIDGRSLVPFLRGQTPVPWRQVMLLAHQEVTTTPPFREGHREPPDAQEIAAVAVTNFTGLRTADGHTYIEYRTGEFELYNDLVDPDQLKNRYAGANAKLKARMAAWLGALRNASGDALRKAEERAP
ncbi:sulfatase family protein [Ideonella sp. YS5]|uniref:sulfatase family protein n=1 Tax=Ideonella sp. YS5 TaxID=3453714 RepID=UPI003EEB00C5